MTTETAALIKGGSMVATGGLVADLVIFNDPAYIPLALVGAIVSASGVIHELSNADELKKLKAVAEVLKGMTLGLLAIPFWFLMLSDIGNQLAQKLFDLNEPTRVGKSVWLMVSFGMAWYTVPIFNWLVNTVVSIMNFIVTRFTGGKK